MGWVARCTGPGRRATNQASRRCAVMGIVARDAVRAGTPGRAGFLLSSPPAPAPPQAEMRVAARQLVAILNTDVKAGAAAREAGRCQVDDDQRQYTD